MTDSPDQPETHGGATIPSTRQVGIRIVADDREPADGVVAALRRHPDVALGIERLPAGDYRVDDQLLFERKTLPDLAASIKDGRLFGQALRLVEATARPALILEGRGPDLAVSRMPRQAIQGALAMLTLEIGLPILRAADPAETAALMLIAARQRRTIATGAVPRRGRRPRGKRRLQCHILQGLPGVGPARARHLIERFGSVEAVVAASRGQLTATRGIGPDTAELMRWAVEEPATAYSA